jgi:hypothetical protein
MGTFPVQRLEAKGRNLPFNQCEPDEEYREDKRALAAEKKSTNKRSRPVHVLN